ncbi:MAG: DUF3592 domain-containing protein [Planctomycetota bacterium]
MHWHQDSDRRARNTAAVIVFGGLFGLVGALLSVLLVLLPLVQTLRVAGWVAAPCVIMSSEVQTHAGETREVYDIALRYSYTYEGNSYEGDRYRLYPLRTSDRAAWQAIAGRYPVGSEQTCYVDPNRPERATLKRVSLGAAALTPLPFLLVSFGVFYGVRSGRIRIGLRGKPAEWRPAVMRGGKTGPAVLNPRAQRIKKLVKLGLVALVWNGIVMLVIMQALGEGWIRQLQTIAGLALSSFGIVGIALLYMTASRLIVVFAPAVRLKIEEQAVPVGGSTTLRWDLPGRPGQVTHLVITVIAEEAVTIRVGGEDKQEKHIFYEQDLTSDQGETTLTIPSQTMHSLEAEHNKVCWMLRVKADVRGWPDIADTFPLTVLPAAPNGASHGNDHD